MAKGFTFIEVLICLLLFAIGMLGALASQIYARQQVLMATQRLLASALVSDVAASLQAVPTVAATFQGNFIQAPAIISLCSQQADCTGEQLLQAQIDQQLVALFQGPAAVLAAAQLCIVAGGNAPQIQLSWRGTFANQFTPKATLCPLPTGYSHVALRAEGGL